MSILFCTFVVEKENNSSPTATRISGKYMLHIEWLMQDLDDVKAFREKLVGYINHSQGNSFQFTESHLILALDLGQIYSYRDMRGVLMTCEHIKNTWCLHGTIVNVEFHS